MHDDAENVARIEEVNEGRLLDCGGHPEEPGRRANGSADCQHTWPKMVVHNAPQQEACRSHCERVRVKRIKLSDSLRSTHVCKDPVGEQYGLERLPCDDGPIRHCDCDCHYCALDPMSRDGHATRGPLVCECVIRYKTLQIWKGIILMCRYQPQSVQYCTCAETFSLLAIPCGA